MKFNPLRIPLTDTNQFSPLFLDYISGKKELDSFHAGLPSIEGVGKGIAALEKQRFPRELLVEVLEKQYHASGLTQPAIQLLRNKDTYTVCTGHQLCLFTGPLYFIYKIITTINLAERLKHEFPEKNFVPVYWMASEDHDFEEIRSVKLFGKTVSWDQQSKGPVGRLSTESMQSVLEELFSLFGTETNADSIKEWISNAYVESSDLADATRKLVDALFGKYGLVILDADDASLKREFHPVMLDDLQHHTNEKLVSQTIRELETLGYSGQVTPRGINLFDLAEGDRVRIMKFEPVMENWPADRLSPNVVLRPLYQQKILPNLAYVGGPGELAYWLEYKRMFDHHGIHFPLLVPRNFAVLVDGRTSAQLKKFQLDPTDLFSPIDELVKQFVGNQSSENINLTEETVSFQELFSSLKSKLSKVDPTLGASVEAEQQKLIGGLKNLETKWLRAEKQKQETSINQLRKIREKVLPGNVLQERVENVIPFLLKYGESLIDELKTQFDPLCTELLFLTILDE